MTNKTFYLYRFLDKNNDVIYIGRTNDINRRILREHFTHKTHLDIRCYLETEKVEYVKFENESEQVAYEAILINKQKPKFNRQFNDRAEFEIKMPELNWVEFKWEFPEQKDLMKILKSDKIQLGDSLTNIAIKLSNGSPNCFVNTGFKSVDQIIMLYPGATMLVAEKDSFYKTKYALNNALQGKKILYLNLNDSSESLTYQIVSMIGNIDLLRLRKGELDAEEIERLSLTMSTLSVCSIEFVNYSDEQYDVSFIEKKSTLDSYDMIIIDDLNSVVVPNINYENEKINTIMSSVKRLSLDIRTPIVMLYSFNQNKKDENGNGPVLSDLSHNGLKNFSDIIQFIYEPTNNKNELSVSFDDKNKMLEVITSKNPLGKNETANLQYCKGRFVDVEICQHK